jgi:hypothetical protein
MLGVMRHLELSRDIRAAWQYNNLCYNVAAASSSAPADKARGLHTRTFGLTAA